MKCTVGKHRFAVGYSRFIGLLTVVCMLANLAVPQSAVCTQEMKKVTDTPATMIIKNARVWTGVKGAAEAQAIAIRGNTILLVGSNEQAEQLAQKDTMVIDAEQRRVIPGISDSHTHFIWAGQQLSRIDLRDAQDKEQFVDLVAAYTAKLSPGQWLQGGQFTVESWDKPETPRKEWIDAVTPGNPVFLTRMDGHKALVNSVALKYARIDRNGPADPPGGEIERDANGEPTGILKDDAMELVSKHLPPETDKEQYDALMTACKVANAWGITCVHDMSEDNDLPIFKMATEQKTLTVRVVSHVSSSDFAKTAKIIDKYAPGNDFFEVQGIKAFFDGSLGSRTGYMREPYSDAEPDWKYPRGMRISLATNLDEFTKQVQWANNDKRHMAIHAIGDQAVHELLDVYATLPDCKSRRQRIEHVQHMLAEDFGRFAKHGIIASMQPLHKADDGRWADKPLGAERSKLTYAFKSLIDAGACVCFGSDVPVVTNNPFSGIAAAVTAKTNDGKVWVPEQKITLEQALYCYTVTPQYAAFREDRLGTLEAGKLADLAILDCDIFTADIDTIHKTESWITIVDGRVVWKKPS